MWETSVGVSAIGRNASVHVQGSININSQQLAQMPTEYAKSLEEFTKTLNDQLQKNGISREHAKPVQDSLTP